LISADHTGSGFRTGAHFNLSADLRSPSQKRPVPGNAKEFGHGLKAKRSKSGAVSFELPDAPVQVRQSATSPRSSTSSYQRANYSETQGMYRSNRIHIDTGAYATGVLTLLIIEGERICAICLRFKPTERTSGGGSL
jgi:hypothetical protein